MKIVIITSPRTGNTYLRSTISQIFGLKDAGELWNYADDLNSLPPSKRCRLLDEILSQPNDLIITVMLCHLFYSDEGKEYFLTLLNRPDIVIITIARRFIDAYVSLMLAQRTDTWSHLDTTSNTTYINTEDMLSYYNSRKTMFSYVQSCLESPSAIKYLCYEYDRDINIDFSVFYQKLVNDLGGWMDSTNERVRPVNKISIKYHKQYKFDNYLTVIRNYSEVRGELMQNGIDLLPELPNTTINRINNSNSNDSIVTGKSPYTLVTIVTEDYLDHAITELYSLSKFQKNFKFYVYTVESSNPQKVKALDRWLEKFKDHVVIVKVEDMFQDKTFDQYELVQEMYEKYNEHPLHDLRWGLKPLILLYTRHLSGADKILFSDPDVYYYHDWTFIFDYEMDTPITLSHQDLYANKNGHTSLTWGHFQAGFIGANFNTHSNFSLAARDLLVSWAELCNQHGIHRKPMIGLFGDQRWLDHLYIKHLLDDSGHRQINVLGSQSGVNLTLLDLKNIWRDHRVSIHYTCKKALDYCKSPELLERINGLLDHYTKTRAYLASMTAREVDSLKLYEHQDLSF